MLFFSVVSISICCVALRLSLAPEGVFIRRLLFLEAELFWLLISGFKLF